VFGQTTPRLPVKVLVVNELDGVTAVRASITVRIRAGATTAKQALDEIKKDASFKSSDLTSDDDGR